MGEGNSASQLLFSQRGIPLKAISQWFILRRDNNPPPDSDSVCSRHSLDRYFYMVYPGVVWLPFLLEQGTVFRGLSQKSSWTFKTPGFKLQELMKTNPSDFPALFHGDMLSFFIPLYASLCLTFLCDPAPSPPFHSTRDPFLLQTKSVHFLFSSMWLCLYLYLWSLFSQSSDWFLGRLEWFVSYLFVFPEWDKPREILLCQHLSSSSPHLPFIILLSSLVAFSGLVLKSSYGPCSKIPPGQQNLKLRE